MASSSAVSIEDGLPSECRMKISVAALIGAVHEIGKLVAIPTPCIDSLLGLVRLYGRTHGLYPA